MDYTDAIVIDTTGFEFFGDHDKRLDVPGIPYFGSEEAKTVLQDISDRLSQLRGEFDKNKQRGATRIEMGSKLWEHFIDYADQGQRKLSHQKNEVVRKVKFLGMDVVEGKEVEDGFAFK